MRFHVCENQRTRMHVTDTTPTLNGHQMAAVTCDWSITNHCLMKIAAQAFLQASVYMFKVIEFSLHDDRNMDFPL